MVCKNSQLNADLHVQLRHQLHIEPNSTLYGETLIRRRPSVPTAKAS